MMYESIVAAEFHVLRAFKHNQKNILRESITFQVENPVVNTETHILNTAVP
jgi:hypothetical protein